MAEWSGFFDAHKIGDSWDRTYLAEDFAKFFAPLIGNGIFAGKSNELQVFQAVPAGMSVVLSSGQAWIEGYGYINDSDLLIPIDPADGALGRIDRVVAQWSAVDRRIRAVWKKGTPAVNPVAPTLRWDADYKELNLCTLDVSAGLSAITQDKIKDTRADTSICGWVTGLIDQVDTSTLFAQWEAIYENELSLQKAAWEKFFGSVQLDLGVPVPSPNKAKQLLRSNSEGSGYEFIDVVPASNGGTGKSSITRGAFLIGNGSDPVREMSPEEVPELIGALQMERLWENASPGSNFAAQNVTVDLSDGDLVAITAKLSTTLNGTNTFFARPGNRLNLMLAATNGNVSLRTVDIGTAATNKITFNVGYNAGSQNNGFIIPLEIFVIKGVL